MRVLQKDSCFHKVPDWAAAWKGPRVLLSSPSCTSEQRKLPVDQAAFFATAERA